MKSGIDNVTSSSNYFSPSQSSGRKKSLLISDSRQCKNSDISCLITFSGISCRIRSLWSRIAIFEKPRRTGNSGLLVKNTRIWKIPSFWSCGRSWSINRILLSPSHSSSASITITTICTGRSDCPRLRSGWSSSLSNCSFNPFPMIPELSRTACLIWVSSGGLSIVSCLAIVGKSLLALLRSASPLLKKETCP